MLAEQPIGIFDSGIGGLTITQAIVKQLPNEDIIYFGDTAHLPYGDKSTSAIQAYTIKITDLLLQHNCKMILIACNSASTAAYDLIKEYVANKAIIMNVIDPLIHHLRDTHANKRLGLIGTRQTINSNIYQKKIDYLNCGISLTSLATNLLASAIEEFGNHKAIDGLLAEYLSHPTLADLDALILACTHYPVIKHKIQAYFNHQLEVIDPSDIIAQAVKKRLCTEKLLNSKGSGSKQFFISDYTESFAAGTKIF
ncbi:MAG: glutamate racemase, partial [Gammaproteobacteria bacterium]|nr:glutamate racemase [Gammaproteobacteria bacterium]